MTTAADRTRDAHLLADLGLRPIINLAGSVSRLGGTRLSPEVQAAMAAASTSFVPIVELQGLASEVIAEATGAEAGIVASGAAACLFLAAAACLAGSDPAIMDQLPNTTGIPNEIAVHRHHRNPYDHAIRAAGGRFVEFGYLGAASPGTWPWQLEAVISDRTAAVFYPGAATFGVLPLPAVVQIAHRHDLPVIVDAAEMLPPPENLRRFIAAGADLVVYSGGKAIGAPAASGMLAGRRDLVRSAAAQQQDMYIRPEAWMGPLGGTSAETIPVPPQQGIGRIVKVGREEILGFIVALRAYGRRDHAADQARWLGLARQIAAALEGAPGTEARVSEPPAVYVPTVILSFAPEKGPTAAARLAGLLLQGEPRIFSDEAHIEANELALNVQHLADDEVGIVTARLREVVPTL